MERLDIVEKLKNINKNENYYKKNFLYKTFFDSKEEYVKMIPSTDPKKEMELLLRMMRCIKDGVIVVDKDEQLLNIELTLNLFLSRKKTMMETVSETLHFIILGKIENIQREYINLWIQQHSHYKIKIWTDNNTYLSREIFVRIQKKASQETFDDTNTDNNDFYTFFKSNVIGLQNEIYQYMQENTHISFDMAAKDFLIRHTLGDPEELLTIWNDNHKSFTDALAKLKKDNPDIVIAIKNIDELDNIQEERKLYIKELALRGNFDAATDIFRLLVLRQYGGVCINPDLLPAVNKELFADIIERTLSDPEGIKSQAIILRVILDELMEQDMMPTRETLLASYQLASIDPKIERVIKQLVSLAQKSGTPLFMPLEELKVDPYFQFSYTLYGDGVVLAKAKAEEKSHFIDQILENLQCIHKIIDNPEHNINGLSEILLLPEKVNPALEQQLANQNVIVDIEALIGYRHTAMARYDRVTPGLAGIRAYDNLYFYQLLQINAIPVVENKYKFQQFTFSSFISVSWITEQSEQSRLLGKMRYHEVFTCCPQYYAQCIIQLSHNDLLCEETAKFLYHTNTELNAWYKYNKRTQELIKVKEAPDLHLKKETRILLVGDGSPINFSVQDVTQLLVQHSIKWGNENVEREQLIFIACGLMQSAIDLLRNRDEWGRIKAECSTADRNYELSETLDSRNVFAIDFIERLYLFLESNRIFINHILVQENLFTIDAMGQRWLGKPKAVRQGFRQKINWVVASNCDKKIKFTLRNTVVKREYQPIEQDLAVRIRVITEFDKNQFSLGDILQSRLVNNEILPERLPNPEKLDGWIDANMATGLKEAILRGAVLINADSMALIVGMYNSTNEILIVDANDVGVTMLIKVLQQVLEKNSYQSWLDGLDCTCGKLQLQALIPQIVGDVEAGFQRLKKRIIHNLFSFYRLSLSEYNSAQTIFLGKYSKEKIKAIYLGNIDRFLLADAANKIKVKPSTIIIEQLNTTFNILSGYYRTIPIYYYSLLSFTHGSNHLQQSSSSQGTELIIENHLDINYMQRIEQLNFSGLMPHSTFMVVSSYNNEQEYRRVMAAADHSINVDEWLPLLTSLKYDSNSGKYKIRLLNMNDFTLVKELESTDKIFEKLRQYLWRQLQIDSHYPKFFSGQSQIKLVGKAGGMGSVFDSVLSLYDFLQYGVNQVKGNSILAKTIQAHIYLSLLADFHNVINTKGTITEFYLHRVCKHLKTGSIRQALNAVGKFNTRLAKGGILLGFISLGLNTLQLIQERNEMQRSIIVVKIALDLMSISLGIVGLIFYSPFAVVAMFVVGIALAVASNCVSDEVMNMLENIEKAKAIGRYFNSMKKGWDQGGILIIKDTLIPCQGTVISEINFTDPQQTVVTFDRYGQQMRKMHDTYTQMEPEAYINLREMNGDSVRKHSIALQNGTQSTTLILPITPRAQIEPIYDFVPFIRLKGDAEFDTVRWFEKQLDAGFVFSGIGKYENIYGQQIPIQHDAYYRAMTGLKFDYKYTSVEIFLGNAKYNLIAPGVSETQLLTNYTYKKYLNYTFYAPITGKADVVLILNKAQADMTINCKNSAVQWIIDARHLSGITTSFDVIHDEPQDNRFMRLDYNIFIRLHFHRFVKSANSEYISNGIKVTQSIEDRITLTIPHFSTTTLTVQLPEGVFMAQLNWESPRLIPLFIDASSIPNINQRGDEVNAVKRYITQHLKNVGQTIKYLRINKFSPDPNEQSEFCFYLCSHETFLYTANHQDTLFRKTRRENVQLLFLSKEYAWYQGDLIIPMVPMPKYARILFKYEKIIWVSEIRTSNLLQVYLPLAHLPSMMENGRQSYTSLSTLNNVNVLAQAITFEQEYHYGSEKIRLKYMIDTLDPYQALALTELYGLPAEVKSQLIEKRHLTGLAAFIKNRSQQVLTPSGINPWEMSGKNIKGLINFKTDTTILIGDRLILPLKNSIDVKGHISARMYTNILKDSDFLISPAGIVKGMKAGDDNYFFWSVTPRQYKQNGNNWLYRLYVQEEGDDAKVMNLREFGLNNHDVVNIRNALITTEKGFIYRLSDDKKLTLFAVENAFIIGNPDWALSLTTYIGQLRNKLADASLLEPGQTKAIEIAIHVSIWGLLYGDENPPLPLSAWYDINSEQFIICKMDLGQNMINLAMSSDNQGAWILNNSKLGYVAKINTFLLGNIFTGGVLHDENKIPKISTLVLNEALGTDFVNVMLIQGNIEGLTNNGIHLNIGRTDDDIFTVTLIGVTTAFSQDHYSDTTYLNVNSLTNAIEHLCHQCICAEIIQIGLKNNLQAWYQPMKKILFMSNLK